jgi:hypothetical protein
MQFPPQFTRPAAQVTVQAPCEQTFPGSHATPQAPQFWLSDASSAHDSPQTVAEPLQSVAAFEHPVATSAATSSAIEMRLIVTSAEVIESG